MTTKLTNKRSICNMRNNWILQFGFEDGLSYYPFYSEIEQEYDKKISLLATFRKYCNCQHVLINLIQKCRQALDSHEYIGLIDNQS